MEKINVSFKTAKRLRIAKEVIELWSMTVYWENKDAYKFTIRQWTQGKLDLIVNREQYTKLYPSQEFAMKRWPRLIGHMIAESLGYFTPRSAANALLHSRLKEPFHCEYYVHMAGGFDDKKVIQAGLEQTRRSFQLRKLHTGYMSSYAQARQVIAAELAGQGPTLASWF